MSYRRHALCQHCWGLVLEIHTPRVPVFPSAPEPPRRCCFCGEMHSSGVLVTTADSLMYFCSCNKDELLS